MQIKDISQELILIDGIWYAKNNRKVSYPDQGNSNCYDIEEDSFWFRHRNNCIVEAVKNYSLQDTFFDIGGGNGFVSKALQDNHIDCILIEPGLNGVLNAKQRGINQIICSTLEDADIKKNSCKAIGLFDVVEHIQDDNLFLSTIYSKLADHGHVYITVPAYNFLWSKDDMNAGHFRRYTLNQIIKVLRQNRFEVIYGTYIFSILPVPVFIFRTLPWLFRMNNSSDMKKKKHKEHVQKNGILTQILNLIWKLEINFIKKKNKIPFGGSCFIVARKNIETPI